MANALLDFAQQVRCEFQKKYGSSGNVICTSDMQREIRNSEQDNRQDNEPAEKKFIYTSPVDFFKNHVKNWEKYLKKEVTDPIDKNFSNND